MTSVRWARASRERFLRGIEPPIGVPYIPRRSLRCWVGLHLWREVWDLMLVNSSTDDSGLHVSDFRGNLDRPADRTECARCNTMKRDRRLARQIRKLG